MYSGKIYEHYCGSLDSSLLNSICNLNSLKAVVSVNLYIKIQKNFQKVSW